MNVVSADKDRRRVAARRQRDGDGRELIVRPISVGLTSGWAAGAVMFNETDASAATLTLFAASIVAKGKVTVVLSAE